MERTECSYKGELSVAFSDAFSGFPEPFSSILQRFSLYGSSVFKAVHSIRASGGGSSACFKASPQFKFRIQSRRRKRELILRNFKLWILFLLLLLFCLLCLCTWFSLLHWLWKWGHPFSKGRVLKWELRADKFLDKYFTSFTTWGVSSVHTFHWKCHTRRTWGRGGLWGFQATDNEGLPPIELHLVFEHCDFIFCLPEYSKSGIV